MTGKHIHPTHQHLRFWSSGVVSVCAPKFSLDLIMIIPWLQQAKVEGVTTECPPHTKMFDANCQSSDDANTLSCHRNALGTQNSNAPSFTFNLAGLPKMLGSNPAAQPNQNAIQAQPAPQPLPAANWPPNMTSLADFAWQYRFSSELHDLLRKGHVTGPHLLHLITDTQGSWLKLCTTGRSERCLWLVVGRSQYEGSGWRFWGLEIAGYRGHTVLSFLL